MARADDVARTAALDREVAQRTRLRFALWLMARCYLLVELIDQRAVPKCSQWAFTFEEGRGAVINNSGSSLNARRGALLWFQNDLDYERAWSDSTTYAGRNALAEFIARHGII